MQIYPYLFFASNCAEAMQYYQSVLGGELKITMVGDSPAASQMPPEAQKSVMHSTLISDRIQLMASDMMDSATPDTGNRMELALICTKDDIHLLFDKLAVGGNVTQPIIDVDFGSFGKLTDKYGINWMFQADK